MTTPSKSTSKASSRLVTRILDKTATPVYVVNNDYVVTYANQACAAWVGVDLERLIGAKCVFASQTHDDKLQDRIQGLCPPPTFFEKPPEESLEQRSTNIAGQNQGLAVSALDQNQSVVWRVASISPLADKIGQTGPQQGVLVVCGDVIEPEKVDPVACAVDPVRLHAALAQIRTQTDRIHSLESLVGVSPYADRIRRQVDTAIRSDVDLLIRGPQGSGKEHLARTIHAARDQANDLLPVHCSIADQQLIQQNIKDFVTSRTNSLSDSSTSSEPQDWSLLLDVDRLGAAAQGELLGFIQRSDFPLRTIATTSRCLIELAEQGSYSKKLAFHLSTMAIEIPALSDRQIDIPLLAQALLERDNSQRDRQLSGFSKRTIQMFSEFNWPENIDQLKRTIQSAASQTQNTQIDEDDLPDEFTAAFSAMRIGTAVETSIELDKYLARIEKQLVDRALKQAKGNKTKAAKLLGISRPKLLRRVQFFELESVSPDFSEIIEPEDVANTSGMGESQ